MDLLRWVSFSSMHLPTSCLALAFTREIESCGFKLVEEPGELKTTLKENCIIFRKVEGR